MPAGRKALLTASIRSIALSPRLDRQTESRKRAGNEWNPTPRFTWVYIQHVDLLVPAAIMRLGVRNTPHVDLFRDA